jgi:hypothetical protein
MLAMPKPGLLSRQSKTSVSDLYLATILYNHHIPAVLRKRNIEMLEAEEQANASQDGMEAPPSKKPRPGPGTTLDDDEAEFDMLLGAIPPPEDDSGELLLFSILNRGQHMLLTFVTR